MPELAFAAERPPPAGAPARSARWSEDSQADRPLPVHPPSVAAAKFRQGLLFERAGDLEAALRAWSQALALDPANAQYEASVRELEQRVRRAY
jgi:tetratricopeptide (TPR) repeat protein